MLVRLELSGNTPYVLTYNYCVSDPHHQVSRRSMFKKGVSAGKVGIKLKDEQDSQYML
jgi:hypothetical protein